jgi:hypothetical protein
MVQISADEANMLCQYYGRLRAGMVEGTVVQSAAAPAKALPSSPSALMPPLWYPKHGLFVFVDSDPAVCFEVLLMDCCDSIPPSLPPSLPP